MKIGVLAPFEESVPPKKYGGTEIVVYNLVEDLIKLGHEVTLIAAGDAKTSATLKPIFRAPLRERLSNRSAFVKDNFRHIGVGLVVNYLCRNEFDLVHNHLGWRILPFCSLLNTPVVTTLHGPLTAPYQQVILKKYKHANFISISMNQRKGLPELNFVSNVYNGIDMNKFKYNANPKKYYLFLGRITPSKGPLEAISIARSAGVKLKIAAKIDPVDREFYKNEVKPNIDGKQIEYVGEANHKQKVKLLCGAKALITPIKWEEPFGLVFIEAMACGTPVITMNRGSVPEIILDKKTGYICNNFDEAIEKIYQIDKIDRKFCSQYVRKRFDSIIMTRGYVETYKKIIKQHSSKKVILPSIAKNQHFSSLSKIKREKLVKA